MRNYMCICKVCNKEFYAKSRLATICSNECRNYNRTKHLVYKRNCIICGIEFETKSHNRLLCGSLECQKKYNCLRTQKYNETHRKPKIKRTCKTKEERQERERLWRESHKEYMKAYRKEYSENNKEKIRSAYNQRIKTDINFRLRQNLCKRIQRAVAKDERTQHTMDLLGCSIDKFKQYLESKFAEGMNWNNYGKNGWVIDHIIPCASFDLTDKEQQKKCFNYKNLQPLWNADNESKSDFLPSGERARDLKENGKPLTSGCLDDSE